MLYKNIPTILANCLIVSMLFVILSCKHSSYQIEQINNEQNTTLNFNQFNSNWQDLKYTKKKSHKADTLDFQIKFKSGWNPNGLFFLFKVQDNKLFDISDFKYPFDIPLYDETDCISLFFSVNNKVKRYDYIRCSNNSKVVYDSIHTTCKVNIVNEYCCFLSIFIPWKSISDKIENLPFEIYAFDNDNNPVDGYFIVDEIDIGNFKIKRTVLSWSEKEDKMNANNSDEGYGTLILNR